MKVENLCRILESVVFWSIVSESHFAQGLANLADFPMGIRLEIGVACDLELTVAWF